MNIIEVDESWRVPVEVLPLTQAFPQLTQLSESGLPEFKEFNERKVVLSKDHERLFGVFTKRSVVIPHEELVEILSDSYQQLYKDDGSMSIVSMKDGAAIRIEMDLPLEKPLDIGNGDLSHLKLFAYNSYDKSFSLKVRTGVMRLICMNGAMIGDQIGYLGGSDLLDGWTTKSLAAKIDRLVKNSRKVTDVWQSWLDIDVPYTAAERVLSRYLPKRFVEPVLLPSLFPMNMYNLYNLMTRRVTHDTRTDRSRVVLDTTLSSIFYSNRLVDAIRGVEPVSFADEGVQMLNQAMLESEIAEQVTITDDIIH